MGERSPVRVVLDSALRMPVRSKLAESASRTLDWVFMDEATSALDEETQQAMMGLFENELAGTTVVSIAHRPGMEAFHSRTMKLVMAAEGARLMTKRSSRPPQRLARAKRRRRQPLTAMMWRPFRSAR